MAPDQEPMDCDIPDDIGSIVAMQDPFQLDRHEEANLLNLTDYYSQQKVHGYMVRPWMNDYVAKPSLSSITQFALFKCMHIDCIFSTDREDIWTAHMIDHIKLIDTFQANKMLTTTIRNNQIKFRECPYCPAAMKSHYGVTWHIEEEHRRSIFQCMHCFYRTIEIDSIVLHYNEFHANERREVLMTGEQREFKEKDARILEGGGQYIDGIQCG